MLFSFTLLTTITSKNETGYWAEKITFSGYACLGHLIFSKSICYLCSLKKKKKKDFLKQILKRKKDRRLSG